MARSPSAYPDDQNQNRLDQTNPPISQPAAMKDVTDHARHCQGGGSTGEVGGDRPAEIHGSPMPPFDGREELPGPAPEDRGEVHWGSKLTHPVALLYPPTQLHTLRDGADLVSGRITTLAPSFAMQRVAMALARAAKTGGAADIAHATEALDHFSRAERLL